ncbi:MAG: TetR/AcrR family transcriptional regulator [Candidatus Binatus sp.]|jgi:AcrR family transcriptional regulator
MSEIHSVATYGRNRSERRDLSCRRIMDAAIKLVARKGSNRTTIDEIGEFSGYTQSLVDARFGSKAELIHALAAQMQADFYKATRKLLDGQRGLGALLIFAENYLRVGMSVPKNALYVLIGEALGPVGEVRPEILAADQNSRSAIQKFIEQGIHDGQIRRDVDPAASAAIVLGLLRGLVMQWLINNQAFALEGVWRELEATISRALAV